MLDFRCFIIRHHRFLVQARRLGFLAPVQGSGHVLVRADAQTLAALLSEFAEKVSSCRRSRRRRDRAAVAPRWNEVSPTRYKTILSWTTTTSYADVRGMKLRLQDIVRIRCVELVRRVALACGTCRLRSFWALLCCTGTAAVTPFFAAEGGTSSIKCDWSSMRFSVDGT
jgi:hypothetical protein